MSITRLQPVISTTGIRKILDNQGREIASIYPLLDGADNEARGKESEYIHNAICDSFNRIAALEAQNKKLVEQLENAANALSNAQGEWGCVDSAYAPEWTSEMKDVESECRALLSEVTQ